MGGEGGNRAQNGVAERRSAQSRGIQRGVGTTRRGGTAATANRNVDGRASSRVNDFDASRSFAPGGLPGNNNDNINNNKDAFPRHWRVVSGGREMISDELRGTTNQRNANANPRRQIEVTERTTTPIGGGGRGKRRGLRRTEVRGVASPPMVKGNGFVRRTGDRGDIGLDRRGKEHAEESRRGNEGGRGGANGNRGFERRGNAGVRVRERNWSQEHDDGGPGEVKSEDSIDPTIGFRTSDNSLRLEREQSRMSASSGNGSSSSSGTSSYTGSSSYSSSYASTLDSRATHPRNFAKDLPAERPCGDVGGCAGTGRGGGGCWFPSESSSVLWLIVCVALWVVWSTYFEAEPPCVSCGWKFWSS